MTKKSSRRSYRVNVGLNYPGGKPGAPEKRAEPGDTVDDLPTSSVPDLLELGYIIEFEEADE